MFATERRNAIRTYLYRNQRIDVSQLSANLGVSEVTIRKDLEVLEKAGVLIRTHGGAVLREIALENSPYGETESAEARHSRSISNIAACLVSDGDMLYLGSGPLCVAIAGALKNKKMLTVVTNNLSAAVLMSENAGIKLITTQGAVSREQGACLVKGTETMAFLTSLSFDKVLLSVDAVKFSSGFSMQDYETQSLYSALLRRTDLKIITAPSECFDRNALYSLGGPEIADILISDESMPEAYIKHFYENNVKVFTTYDIEKP